MKHEQVAIEFDALLERVLNGSDTPWRQVLGVNHDRLDEIEVELSAQNDPETDVALITESFRLDSELIASLSGTWWHVSWPEHVITPRYNSDATYQQCRSREEALDGAVEYGS